MAENGPPTLEATREGGQVLRGGDFAAAPASCYSSRQRLGSCGGRQCRRGGRLAESACANRVYRATLSTDRQFRESLNAIPRALDIASIPPAIEKPSTRDERQPTSSHQEASCKAACPVCTLAERRTSPCPAAGDLSRALSTGREWRRREPLPASRELRMPSRDAGPFRSATSARRTAPSRWRRLEASRI